jgi:hypothetical protein
MALKPEDLERLRISIEDLTRADRELFEATQRASGVGAEGPVSLTKAQQGQLAGKQDVTAVAGGAQVPFWQQAGKFDDAVGHGLSAAKSMLSAGGFGAMGSLVGGLAHGPMGLVEAAAGIGGQFLQQKQAQVGSALDTFVNAPPTDTDSMIRSRVQHDIRRSKRDAQNTFEERYGMFMGTGEDLAGARLGRAFEQRLDDQQFRKEMAPKEAAESRVWQRLQNFAEAGGLSTPGGRAVADEMYRVELERTTRGIADFQNWATRRDERQVPGAPGAQGRLGPK